MPGPLYSYVASASQFCRFTVAMEVVVVVVVVVYGMLVWGRRRGEEDRDGTVGVRVKVTVVTAGVTWRREQASEMTAWPKGVRAEGTGWLTRR